MLKEIALTPHVFDEASNPDSDAWLDALDALGHGLFPRGAAPMVAANLYGGAWMGEVVNKLGSIRDHRVRDRVQRIITQLKNILVPRPLVRGWPEDERGWAEEAIASRKFEPISRVVTTNELGREFVPEEGECHGLASVEGDEFWQGISSACPVSMDLDTQVALLRPLCVHAQYLALVMPHVRGGPDDETEFVVRVVDSAFRRPVGFSSMFVELHLNADGYQRCPDNLIDTVRQSLAAGLSSSGEVRLFLWPKFTERLFIAGDVKIAPDGKQTKYPRWGVSFNHIARPKDSLPPTRWHLIPRCELGGCERQFDPGDPRVIGSQLLTF